ncbi:T9SS C-terminal target domain-containing protein [Sphingobacteriales bacterium UPWRP_1]|nr:hypothetical protein B6N25_15755 [Sphingobacteriales bacterium TSM_CSS]PSJ74450.1 T9SS C-terminal target domain-containing protein [Sphingobacteriales bacterium UPWRP_1]
MKSRFIFLLLSFLMMLLLVTPPCLAQLQTFSANIAGTIDLTGANGSCTTPGSATPNMVTIPVSGVGVLGAANAVVQVKVTLNNTCTGGSMNLNNLQFRLKSPSGTCVGIYGGGLSTTATGTHEIALVSNTACLNNPDANGSNSAGVQANSSGNFGFFNAQFSGTGANLTASFSGENANGTWQLIFSESTTSEPCLTGASIAFGNPDVDDQAANGNDCTGAIVWDGGAICASTNSKTGSVLMPGSLTGPNGTSFGTIGGVACTWNGANNNDVWLKFTPTSPNVCISISGLDFSLQSVVVQDANQDGDNNPCTANAVGTTNDQRWNLISCPVNSIYTTSAGTARNQNHCFTATVGQTYYLVVDGNGGAESPFYIGAVSGLPAVESLCPTFTAAPPNVTVTNSACVSGCTVSGGSILAPTGTPCPAGSHLEYSTDDGLTWLSQLPVYQATGPAQTIISRCECDSDASVVSAVSAPVSTAPAVCPAVTALITVNETGGNTTLGCTPSGAGSIEVTATGGASYAWSGGATPALSTNSFTTAGTYTVTVTNANGCAATAQVSIGGSTAPPLTAITVNETGGNTTLGCTPPGAGSIEVTATGGASYAWSGGATPALSTNSFTTAGTYTVTVTNANGCAATAQVSIGGSTAPPLTAITVNETGGNTTLGCTPPGAGSIEVTATGGASYAWSGGATPALSTNSFTTAGTYTVTVTNANGCAATAQVNVGGSTALPVATISGPSSACRFTAGLSLTASGGGAYQWSSSGANSSGSSSAATLGLSTVNTGITIYVVTVTAANGCTTSASKTVTVNPNPLVSIASPNYTVCQGSSVTVDAAATGGTLPYTHLWTGNGSAYLTTFNTSDPVFSAAGVLPGSYTLNYQVQDANGCQSNTIAATVTVVGAGGGLGNGQLTGNQFEGTPTTSVPTFYNINTIELSGGVQPYQYQWTTNGYVQYNTVLNANGSVTITVIYADGASWDLTVTDSSCGANALYFDNQPDDPTSSDVLDIISYTITPDIGTSNGAINISVEGGTPCPGGIYHYAWQAPSAFNGNLTDGPYQTGLISGWYIVTVTDCGGQQTLGWYWVPRKTRGRGKLDQTNLLAVYPNPVANSAVLEFNLLQTAQTHIALYSPEGKLIMPLYNGLATAGQPHEIPVQFSALPAGLYFVTLTAQSGVNLVQRLVINR